MGSSVIKTFGKVLNGKPEHNYLDRISKSEIGRVSKLILDRINTKVIEATRINQWKNIKSVLSWFNQVVDKSQYSFIAFDVVDFYPSISIDLLKAALDFASKYDNITDTER